MTSFHGCVGDRTISIAMCDTLRLFCCHERKKNAFFQQHTSVLMCENHAVCYDYFDLLPGWMEELSSGVFLPQERRIAYCIKRSHSRVITFIIRGLREQRVRTKLHTEEGFAKMLISYCLEHSSSVFYTHTIHFTIIKPSFSLFIQERCK